MKTKSLLKTAALCASIAIGSTVSQAAVMTETHMSTIPSSLTDFFGETFDPIPLFNPALGTLQEVEITLDADIVSTLILDNDAPDSVNTIGTVSTVVTGNFAGLTINLNPEASPGVVNLGGDDSGNTDAPGDGGPDEMVFVDLFASDSDTVTLTAPPADLSDFIGVGNISPDGDLTALAGFSVAGGGGNVDASVDTMAQRATGESSERAAGRPTCTYATGSHGPDQQDSAGAR